MSTTEEIDLGPDDNEDLMAEARKEEEEIVYSVRRMRQWERDMKKPTSERMWRRYDEAARHAEIRKNGVNLPPDHPCHKAVEWSGGRSGMLCRECLHFH